MRARVVRPCASEECAGANRENMGTQVRDRRLRANEISGIARRGPEFLSRGCAGRPDLERRSVSRGKLRTVGASEREQKDHNQQRWQPLMDGFLVLVEGREGAERSDRRCHEFWKGNVLLPRVTNIIVRCVTKRTTNICPNLLSQIGALTWRRLKLRRSGLQVNLNVKGCDIVSDPVYAPSREQKCRPLG
jgi:hypothetical protein